MAEGQRRLGLTTRLPLERIVFDGEVAMRNALMKDSRFRKLSERHDGEETLAARRTLLLSALRLTPEMAPEPFAALAQVRRTLALQGEIELYCVSSRDINAFVARSSSGPVLLGLTSEALERFDATELRFVLGHELGHVLFDHFRLSPAVLAEDDEVAPIHLVRLCAWCRYAELTADRVGLLCADDYDAAVRAFFKLTSGLSGASYLRHAELQAEQYTAVHAEGLESDASDWLSTHPYGPLRVKALDLFARSETYHELLGRSGSSAGFHRLLGRSGSVLSEKELEREVGAIVKLMDPTFLHDESDSAPVVKEFLALAGMKVALADGTVQRGEREALGKLVGKRGVTQAKEQLLALDAEGHEARLAELCHTLALKLSRNRRARLIEDLVVVALADRELHDAEVAVILDSAERLGVSVDLVERAVARTFATLD